MNDFPTVVEGTEEHEEAGWAANSSWVVRCNRVADPTVTRRLVGRSVRERCVLALRVGGVTFRVSPGKSYVDWSALLDTHPEALRAWEMLCKQRAGLARVKGGRKPRAEALKVAEAVRAVLASFPAGTRRKVIARELAARGIEVSAQWIGHIEREGKGKGKGILKVN